MSARDCGQGIVLRMGSALGATYEHQLGPNFEYCRDPEGRLLFTLLTQYEIAASSLVSREHPEDAELVSVEKHASRWDVAPADA
jgi:hypothetical protein